MPRRESWKDVTLPVARTENHALFQGLGFSIRGRWGRLALGYQSSYPEVLYLVVCCLQLIWYEDMSGLQRHARNMLRDLVPLDCGLWHFCKEWCERAEETNPDAQTFEMRQTLLAELRGLLRPECLKAAERQTPPRTHSANHTCWSLSRCQPAPVPKAIKARRAALKRREKAALAELEHLRRTEAA